MAVKPPCIHCGRELGHAFSCPMNLDPDTSDELLPFREAARLGCKDFTISKYIGTVRFKCLWPCGNGITCEIPIKGTKWPDCETSYQLNRQAAACCYWFWANRHDDKPMQSFGMRRLLEVWAVKHCAPKEEERPGPLSDSDKLNILWDVHEKNCGVDGKVGAQINVTFE